MSLLSPGFQSHDSVANGKHEKASSRARLSRKMSHIALCFGLLVWVITIGLAFGYGVLITKLLQREQQHMQEIQDAQVEQFPIQQNVPQDRGVW